MGYSAPVPMSRPAHNQGPLPASGDAERAAAQLLSRAVSAVGVVAAMGLYLAVSPLIAMGTGFIGFLLEIRDAVVRPRPLVGARHGLPFLDRRPAAAIPNDPSADFDTPEPIAATFG